MTILKIPKQEFTAEFKELGSSESRMARRLALGRADPVQLGQGLRCRQAQRPRDPKGDAGRDGTLAAACREYPAQAGERNSRL